MNSMTGFGRAVISSKVGSFTVEVSTVNNRFLEVSIRLPRRLSALEPKLREQVSEQIRRGKANVFVSYDESENAPSRVSINSRAIKEYVRQLRALQKELKMSGDFSLGELMNLPDVAIANATDFDAETLWPHLKKTSAKALGALVAMRSREGNAMARQVKKNLASIKTLVEKIERGSKGSTDKYRRKLHKRIDELLEQAPVNESRLEEEVAVFAERSDISEEITRLKSHTAEFQASLKSKSPVGKRLNFVLQELNREANTIGSKTAETAVASSVIALKEEIEMLREMVQNVE